MPNLIIKTLDISFDIRHLEFDISNGILKMFW